jgi:ketosteroid isomerase-like protein
MNKLTCLKISLLAVSIYGCTAPEKELNTNEKLSIETTLKNYRQAWLNTDTANVMNVLSGDVTLFVPGLAEPLIGRAAAKENWFPASDTKYPITKYEIDEQQIFGTCSYAIVQGNSLLEWDTVKKDSVTGHSSARSRFLTVMRKEGNDWKIFRQMFINK